MMYDVTVIMQYILEIKQQKGVRSFILVIPVKGSYFENFRGKRSLVLVTKSLQHDESSSGNLNHKCQRIRNVI